VVCWRDHRQHAGNGSLLVCRLNFFRCFYRIYRVDVVEQRAGEKSNRVKSAVGFISEINILTPTYDPVPDTESLRLNGEFQSVLLQPDRQWFLPILKYG